MMIAKKRIRLASVPETDDIFNEGEMPDFSSEAMLSLALNPNKRGKQVPVSKLKDTGSKVTSTRKLGVQFPAVQSVKYLETDGSMQGPSYKEHVAQFGNISRTANCAKMGPGSSEGSVELAEHRKRIQKDIEAALILMQLSNDNSGLLKTKVQSPSSKGACLSQRNQNTRKVGSYSTWPWLEYVNNDVVEQDNPYNRHGKFRTKGLSLLKLKKAAERTKMGRQIELDYHCTKGENVIKEIELPISSLNRKKLLKSSLQKRGLKKVKAELGSFEGLTAYSSYSISEIGNNTVQEPKPFKKMQFNSSCPTAHTGFSFSIIHFLSAIRTALITPGGKDHPSAVSKYPAKSNPKSVSRYHERKGISNSQGEQKSLPCLTMHEIVERVRLNPGDPCILKAREPLQELVRGALTIFSSTTAPLGAKAWKALTLYSKSNKSWSWIGPVAIKPHNHMKEAVSSAAWGLPSRTLLKLVNCFADWLKIAQESLQKIGDLPAPPLTLMHRTVNVNERLREVRPRKMVATISQCPKEIRDYFRKEEAIRYFIPERAFSYTALDGRKSTVAPLRRCSGKPSLKCRKHFMLKADRPPNITVLSLARDAAARLPAGMGTRADVCVLIRDSQYIVEEISEEQLNQVVSGALDRLHYEHDPCVQFNGERRLWFYLHGEREEDDFEYDATLSTKKRRRQREIP
ncbi:uncharacterized protein LOC111294393 [Durio zibethinus]|uniref:Uncharacterized protein LOC111294393 n=1 Tax=Durio zibethinus TaxID=66656 RepID=A0A6P5YS98_DURZI|nr:uncharacterized protein LOC111294393 [Durio zibethinus]